MFRIVCLTTLLAAASARYNIHYAGIRQEPGDPNWEEVSDSKGVQDMFHHVVDLMREALMLRCDNNAYAVYNVLKKKEGRRQGEPTEAYKFMLQWKERCHTVQYQPACSFHIEKVGGIYDVVDVGCEGIHWVVTEDGAVTEVPPPPPTTENPEVVTETVTPEVQTIDPATTDITAPGLTDYPEPEYPEYPEWSRTRGGRRQMPRPKSHGSGGGHQIFVMGDEKN